MYKILVYIDKDVLVHESYYRSGDMSPEMLKNVKADLAFAYRDLYHQVPVDVIIEKIGEADE